MPLRLNAKGPGEFIRDHLQGRQIEGRDYGPDPRDVPWSMANCTWQDPEPAGWDLE